MRVVAVVVLIFRLYLFLGGMIIFLEKGDQEGDQEGERKRKGWPIRRQDEDCSQPTRHHLACDWAVLLLLVSQDQCTTISVKPAQQRALQLIFYCEASPTLPSLCFWLGVSFPA